MGPIIQKRTVDNPMLTDGLKYAEETVKKPRKGSVVFTTERKVSQLTRITVDENAMTRIGALCFIRRRLPHHEMAAERFKSLYEARYGAGNSAMDPGREQVDTSPIAHDSGMAAKLDRTAEIQGVEKHDKGMFDRLVALLVLCVPVTDDVPITPSGQRNKRHEARAVEQALSDLDRLSVVFKLMNRSAGLTA